VDIQRFNYLNELESGLWALFWQILGGFCWWTLGGVLEQALGGFRTGIGRIWSKHWADSEQGLGGLCAWFWQGMGRVCA
jgi:hypothetical protein